VILIAASGGALVLLRHQGVGLGGDEPYYMVEAVSIGRFHTLNLNPGYAFAVNRHVIFPWVAHSGPHLAAQIGQGAPHYKDGLVLSGHSVGLSALLAIPTLVNTHVGVAALIVILAALAIALAHVVGEIAEIETPWRVLIAGLFLAPAYLLATTQLYPDLISGLIMAIVIGLLALVERHGNISGFQLAVGSALLTILPWFDEKNILLAPVLITAVIVVYFRTRLSTTQLAWFVLPSIVSLVGLLWFNTWGFGSPFGAFQPISLSGLSTVTRFLALLFDRRQGLTVQFPVSLLGFAGIWISRRRNPVAAAAAIIVVLAVVYGNATQVVSFGGGSFVGRFEWPVVPVLFAFAGLYLLELWKIRPGAVKALGILIGGLYVLQAVPILLDEHLYFNQLAWDPSRYSGWWPLGGIDPSPVLGYLGGVGQWPATVSNVIGVSSNTATSIVGVIPGIHWWTSTRTAFGLACLVLSSATVVYLLVILLRRPFRFGRRVLGSLLVLSVITGIGALTAPVLLPAPIRFDVSSYQSTAEIRGTSRILTGPTATVSGPFWTLLSGRYEATVEYGLLSGTGHATLTVSAISPESHSETTVLQPESLSNASTFARVKFNVEKAEQVTLRVRWEGSGSLEVRSVILAKGGTP